MDNQFPQQPNPIGSIMLYQVPEQPKPKPKQQRTDCSKSPLAIRLVTMGVLMISDLDVVFSFMFLANLAGKGGLYTFFLVMCVLGMVTYVVGSMWYAPNQKFKVFPQVKRLMQEHPDEFVSTKYRVRDTGQLVVAGDSAWDLASTKIVSLSDPCYPPSRSARTADTIFNNLTVERYDDFQKGLRSWGCGALWDRVEIKNSWNVAERKHGIPLVRLARFGFMAQPSAKDLSGILNANALYSFSSGIMQLAFGILLIIQFGVDTQALLPLVVASASLILSLMNVFCDFAGKLATLDCEQRQAEAIIRSLANDEDEQLEAAKKERNEALKKVARNFKGKTDPQEIIALGNANDNISNNYAKKIQAVARRSGDLKKIEMKSYRQRLKQNQDFRSGISIDCEDDNVGSQLDGAMRIQNVLQRQLDAVNQHLESQLASLNVAELSADQLQTKTDELRIEAHWKTQSLKAAGNGAVPCRRASSKSTTFDHDEDGSSESEDEDVICGDYTSKVVAENWMNRRILIAHGHGRMDVNSEFSAPLKLNEGQNLLTYTEPGEYIWATQTKYLLERLKAGCIEEEMPKDYKGVGCDSDVRLRISNGVSPNFGITFKETKKKPNYESQTGFALGYYMYDQATQGDNKLAYLGNEAVNSLETVFQKASDVKVKDVMVLCCLKGNVVKAKV